MQSNAFAFMADFLKTRSGLVLTPEKEYLLESRLNPVARARGLDGIPALVLALKTNPRNDLVTEVVEAMTTNESLFFRDGKPFEQMRETLFPHLRKSAESRKSLRIWSAACSTGQEPYSVAITLLEDAGAPGWQHEIIATDIAQKVLDKAQGGIYTQFEVQRGLSIQQLVKYFDPQADTTWRVKDNLRAMVQFRFANLLEDFTTLGKFDMILCRNVLIYFDDATKMAITERMAKMLQPGGILMIGATESILDKASSFTAMEGQRGVYKVK